MAITASISQKELERVAALAYEGETLNVALCSIGSNSYTAETAVATWLGVEKSGNGYARYSEVIAAGSYDAVTGTYKMPSIDAEFTASGVGYSYDRIVLYVEGATYPHSVLEESPNITLSPGQTQTYRLDLNTND
jgi:hypothetical protein